MPVSIEKGEASLPHAAQQYVAAPISPNFDLSTSGVKIRSSPRELLASLPCLCSRGLQYSKPSDQQERGLNTHCIHFSRDSDSRESERVEA